MKVLVLLFLIGCASAFVHEDFDKKVDDVVDDFLKELIGDFRFDQIHRADDTKTELEQRLRESFDKLLEKVKDALDRGQTVKEDLLQKLKELREKMNDMKIDIGEKAKELYKKIKEKAKDFINDFLDKLGLRDNKNSRAIVFESEVENLIRRAADDKNPSELEKKLREAFERILEEVKDAMSRGRIVKKEVLQELKELRERLRDLKADLSDKAKEMYKIIKEKAKDYIKNLLDRLGLNNNKATRAVVFDENVDALVRRADEKDVADRLREALNNLLEKIKVAVEKGETIKENLVQKLKDLAKKIKEKEIDVGNRARELYEQIREKARDFLKNLLDNLGKDNKHVARSDIGKSLQDLYEKVRDYFKKLNIEIKEKYVKFGQWVKDTVKKGVDTSKSRLDNIKGIAKEFIEKAKLTEKDIAAEALEFFKVYKEDLGSLWDELKKSVKEVFKRED